MSSAFSVPSPGRLLRASDATTPPLGGRLTQPRTQLAARSGEAEAEADTIEVGGFAGLIVGLALLPYVAYTLKILFDMANGAALTWGPYALNAISPAISLGVLMWSLGSYIQRGRGLPVGPLGLFGITEGLSYLAFLGAAIVFLIAGNRPGGINLPAVPLPAAPTISVPSGLKAPELSVPKFQAPEFKAPDVTLPAIKAPEVKLPEIKAPDVKLPEVKAPSIKVPEVKLPEKAPAKKEPEKKEPEKAAAKKEAEKAPAKKEPETAVAKKEAEKKEAPATVKAPAKPAAPAAPAPDYDSLFD